MNFRKCFARVTLIASCAVVLTGSTHVLAQESADLGIEQRPTAENPAPEHVLDRGDNAWVLTSSAMVLAMTTPGLAMFYGGLVRKKNVVSVLMQCMFLMGLMGVLWVTIGYTLCFGGSYAATSEASSPWIGNLDNLWMQGVQPYWDESAQASVIPLHPKLNISWLSHMLFQGMFFIITPALICGAIAERMKFSTMVVFMTLWGLLVYCPLCHWVWGNGIFTYGSDSAMEYCFGGALDFAGGTVVHISSGVSALVCAMVLGKRAGYPREPMPPHNLTYTALGAGLLWVGWFGFNAGSALAADGIAASAFTATHFSAAAGALAWAAVDWIRIGKPTLLGASSGAVAGLVCITPAAGHVLPMYALVMGGIAGVVCSFAVSVLKPKLGYDDSLDAFGVHGLGGTLGALLTGVFATRAVFDAGSGARLGLIEGGTVFKAQAVAAFSTWLFAAGVTLVLLKVLDLVMGLRVSRDEEQRGLDLSQHHEEGYIFL